MGTGEGESPLMKPAVPNVDVRTMSSDMQSINTGSPAPKPYVPQAAPENMAVIPPTPNASVPDQSFQIPQADTTFGSPMPEVPTKKSGKGIFTAVIVFIAVVGLAALGYFVIYPIFFANQAAPVVENTNPVTEQPVLPAPEPTPTPEPAPIPEATSTPTPAPAHISVLTTPADGQIEATAITTGATLAGLNLGSSASPSLTEMIYKNSAGEVIKPAEILNVMTGLNISENSALSSAFNELSGTGFVYADANGRWLGFAAQLNSSADLASVSATFNQVFESVSNYGSLFAGAPGAAKTWKASQVAGATNHRFLTFANSGFAIDYGWVGNKLVISTSFDGFKEIIKRLQ